MSVVDCSVYGGLILGLYWTVNYREDCNLVCSGLNSIRRTGTGHVVDCRLYRRREHIWYLVDYREYGLVLGF